jgi:hypothetical protein
MLITKIFLNDIIFWIYQFNYYILPDVGCISVISALRRLKQEDQEFEATLGYIA